MSAGKILYLDAYDSFSNNIISLLRSELDVEVTSIKIDDPRYINDEEGFHQYVATFVAVVAGPGPGHPSIEKDIGLIEQLWSLPPEFTVPVLGICLGFQSLCLSQGASAERLSQPRHGILTNVSHKQRSIFKDVGDVSATQYHSLHVKLHDRKLSVDSNELWTFSDVDSLEPLAWDLSDTDNGPILMAVKRTSKPWVGLQFHPESICTNEEGRKLIRNWWNDACEFNEDRAPKPKTYVNGRSELQTEFEFEKPRSLLAVESRSMSLPKHITAVNIADLFRSESADEPLVLQSGARDGRQVNAETGRFSIIGLPDHRSVHIRYHCQSQTLSISVGTKIVMNGRTDVHTVFTTLEQFVEDHKAEGGDSDVPFWGGLIGYVSYEAGLETIQVEPPSNEVSNRSDMWFVFIERSVVIDHSNNKVYYQSIRKNDAAWLNIAQTTLHLLCMGYTTEKVAERVDSAIISMPTQADYEEKVLECQSHLRAGSAYELCLTDQTLLQCDTNAWKLYTNLSEINPAPFGAYMRLQSSTGDMNGVTIVGSSPERFLSWTRSGRCQFRPIKGTVSKADGMTRDQADKILNSTKERAENLMIVDLIRHDLSGVPGIKDVCVPLLMSTEEYESVYQLVSVIEGDLAPTHSGVSVLAASLPPGSMTGAPKKRSCELLNTIEEDNPRGIYSGVLGYMDVGGGGDFSVVIRTAFRWDDDSLWRIGAGGAVTILSTPEGEYDEMIVKRERLGKLFCP